MSESPGQEQAESPDARIGATVRALRGHRPQRDVAKAMRARGHQWNQSTVWQIENGTRPLRLFEALELAAELGVSLERLLTPDQVIVRGPMRDMLDALADLNEATDKVSELRAELEKAERTKEIAEQAFRRAQAAHDKP
jgi:transcriptional regulator with XRE-family HTH domain